MGDITTRTFEMCMEKVVADERLSSSSFGSGQWQASQVREIELRKKQSEKDKMKHKSIDPLDHKNVGSLLLVLLWVAWRVSP